KRGLGCWKMFPGTRLGSTTMSPNAAQQFNLWESWIPKIRRWMQFVPLRRLGAEQMTHKIVPAAADHVRLVPETMVPVREQQQIEILVRLDQLVDHDQRVVWRNI